VTGSSPTPTCGQEAPSWQYRSTLRHVPGTGHLAPRQDPRRGGRGGREIGAEEVFSRAGGLACIVSFIDDGFYLGNGAARSMAIERTPGYARAILSDTDFDEGDLLIIVNAYGINAATIDSATYAHELGMTTIGRGRTGRSTG
jgi:SIS domain